jgi:hypothetical protein
VVPGDPDDLREALAEQRQCPLHVGDLLADVTCDDEPVGVGAGAQGREDVTVVGVCDVQVADCQQVSVQGQNSLLRGYRPAATLSACPRETANGCSGNRCSIKTPFGTVVCSAALRRPMGTGVA